ncbi:MAG: glycosyltransferase family 4 protein [Suilimivivens sp.]
MKILADVRVLGKHPSGIGMYLYHFICGLKKYEDIQIELVTDVAESEEIRQLEEAQIPMHRYGTYIAKSIGVYPYFRFVQKKIYEVRPDIFWEGNNLIPVKLRNPFGKVVVTVHDIFPITFKEGYSRLYQYYFRLNLHRTIRNVDAILYDSEDTRHNLEKYDKRAALCKHMIAYAVVDHLPDMPVSKENYFLYVGNMEKRKGTDTLLRAYCLYREKGGKRELYLGGKIRDPKIGELLEECQSKTEGIHYLGYVEPKEKYRLYAACAAFIFPSRAEGFGIPVMEALHYGKTVIVSDLAIFDEIAGDVVFRFSDGDSQQQREQNLAELLLKEPMAEENEARKVADLYVSERLAGKLRSFLI